MPKGAGPVRPVEGGKWRPATRRTDAGRLRGGARPGNKQCRVRRSIQPTHSERALLIARRHGGTLGGLLIRKTRRDGPAVAEGSVIDTAWTYLNLPRQRRARPSSRLIHNPSWSKGATFVRCRTLISER